MVVGGLVASERQQQFFELLVGPSFNPDGNIAHPVKFVVKSTSVTHRFTFVVSPPKCCVRCVAVGAAESRSP